MDHPTINTVDINPGRYGSTLWYLTAVGEKLFFSAHTTGWGREVYAMDVSGLVPFPTGDMNGDYEVDVRDVDVVCKAIDGPFTGRLHAEFSDVLRLVEEVFGTSLGDTNLDGTVDAIDLNRVGRNWQRAGDLGWSDGDVNCDHVVDDRDLNLIASNWPAVAIRITPRGPRAAISARVVKINPVAAIDARHSLDRADTTYLEQPHETQNNLKRGHHDDYSQRRDRVTNYSFRIGDNVGDGIQLADEVFARLDVRDTRTVAPAK
jgi:hypothetical protein